MGGKLGRGKPLDAEYTDLLRKYDTLMHRHGQAIGLMRDFLDGIDALGEVPSDVSDVAVYQDLCSAVAGLEASGRRGAVWLASVGVSRSGESLGGVMGRSEPGSFVGDVGRWTDSLAERVVALASVENAEVIRMSRAAHSACKELFPNPHGMVEIGEGVLGRVFPGLKQLDMQVVFMDGTVKSGFELLPLEESVIESASRDGGVGLMGVDDLEHNPQWKHVVRPVKKTPKWQQIQLDKSWDGE